MRIGIIGGVERDEHKFIRLARARGHAIEFHAGHLQGRSIEALDRLIDRSELVIILTDVNSHGAVQYARKAVTRRGGASLLLRRCGSSSFSRLLDALDARVEDGLGATLSRFAS